MAKTNESPLIKLKDYKRPNIQVETIALTFYLAPTKTKVMSRIRFNNTEHVDSVTLNGEDLDLLLVRINNKEIDKSQYRYENNHLTVTGLPHGSFILETEVFINPEANKTLEGLYLSSGIFCTQNEPEGFRRITFYLDRPDVMAKYTTKIIADREKYPVLLSNGNMIDYGIIDDNTHYAIWEDPFKKPSYLYALVAGDLGVIEGEYYTKSGRRVELKIYCDKGNEYKCHHALESLKKSMKWDEDTYGLEYDLDIYMIVAVDSFNMGAMENKGLNIFNSAYVLASQATATDNDYHGIESVVAHEYFHNWTGNRITCRDWFQLTLKEGLTVYRDQEFSSDMHSRAVQRISDVDRLRAAQFVEDQGPTSHPIRPDQYVEINNFYTPTIYEKGAEVIRMLEVFLGKTGFRKGMDKYFELYDGMAVTTEDFLNAFSLANDNFDMTQFKRWYRQSGTPELKFETIYKDGKLHLTIDQVLRPTLNQSEKESYHMPLAIGFLDDEGRELEVVLDGGKSTVQPFIDRGILNITNISETFVFKNLEKHPILSLNRNFSAPVIINYKQDADHILMSSDRDAFNRYESCKNFGLKELSQIMSDLKTGKRVVVSERYLNSYEKVLKDESMDLTFLAQMIHAPLESEMHAGQEKIDIEYSHFARQEYKNIIANRFHQDFLKAYDQYNKVKDFRLDARAVGERRVKNIALSYLVDSNKKEMFKLALDQMINATNMTDEIMSLNLLCLHDCSERHEAIDRFFHKWKHETLVMQKWIMAQSSSHLHTVHEDLLKLEKSPVYDKTVPNLVRSLMRGFGSNYVRFHEKSGIGYKFVMDRVLDIDTYNPRLAAGMAGLFKQAPKLIDTNKLLIVSEIDRALGTKTISKDVVEILSKILEASK